MTSTIKAWQCIGCGRIDSPQNCIGICQDRKVEFVYASEHAQALALVRQLATTTPRDGKWEASYRELQRKARRLLGDQADDASARPGTLGAPPSR